MNIKKISKLIDGNPLTLLWYEDISLHPLPSLSTQEADEWSTSAAPLLSGFQWESHKQLLGKPEAEAVDALALFIYRVALG